MNTQKLLSIIIPTYNMERYLSRCLDSLVKAKEALPKLEILVINDGSKDASSRIAHQYQDRFPDSVVVIDKENGNYGSCVNRGLKEATGKYIKVLDADDWFDTNVLNHFVEYLSTMDNDLVLSDYHKVDETGKVIGSYGFDVPKGQDLTFRDYCAQKSLLGIQMHAVTYKASLLRTKNYTQKEGISYTDQEWIFLPMAGVKTFSYYASPLYMYLIGREGQTMAAEVIAKSIGQFVQLVMDMADKYATIHIADHAVKKYLDHRFCDNVRFVYNRGLLAKIVSTKLVDQLDGYLAQYKNLYELTNNIVVNERLPFKFVKYYRTHHSNLPWYISLIYNLHTKWKRSEI